MDGLIIQLPVTRYCSRCHRPSKEDFALTRADGTRELLGECCVLEAAVERLKADVSAALRRADPDGQHPEARVLPLDTEPLIVLSILSARFRAGAYRRIQ